MKTTKQNPRLFLDLDDVCTSFIDPACEIHGWSRDLLEQERTARGGIWSMQEVIGLSEEEFWEPINKQDLFWYHRSTASHFSQLIELVRRIDPDYKIVTSCGSGQTKEYFEKVHWCEDQLGLNMHRVIPMKDKWELANEHSILIDDSQFNCESFKNRNGHAILFPERGNANSEWSTCPVGYVSAALHNIMNS